MFFQKKVSLVFFSTFLFSLFPPFFSLFAEDTGCEIDLFNERGFLKGNTYTSEASGEHISDFNGNLTYSKEILYCPGRGDLDLHVTINYNGSVNHTIQRWYYDNAPIITMDFPEWILGVNGIAVQVFNFKKKWYRDTTQSYPAFVVEGYDKSNPVKDNGWSLCFLMAEGSIEEYISSDVPNHCYWGKYIPTQAGNFSFAWQQYTTQNCNQKFKMRRKDGIVITYEEETADFYDRPPGHGDDDNKLFHTYYPTSIEDRFGNKITLHYAYVWNNPSLFGRKMITGITDACGREIKINITGITQQLLYADIYFKPDTSSGDELVRLEFNWDPGYHIYGGDNSVHYLCKKITQKINDSNSRITSFTHGSSCDKCVRIQSPVTTDYMVFSRRLVIITHSTGSTCLFKYVPADDFTMYWDHLTGNDADYWSATLRATGREPFVVSMVDTMIKRDSESNIERKVSFSYKWSEENPSGYAPRHKDDYEYYTIKVDSGNIGLRPQGEEYVLMRKDSFCFREYPIKDISNPYSFLQHYKWSTKLFGVENKNFYSWKKYYWNATPHGSGENKYYDGIFKPDSIVTEREGTGAKAQWRRFKHTYLYDTLAYGNVTKHTDPLGNGFYYQYYYHDQTEQGLECDHYIVDKVSKGWIGADSSFGLTKYTWARTSGLPHSHLRLIQKREKINNNTYASTYFSNYDDYGNCRKIINPEGDSILYSYNDYTSYRSGNHGFWTSKKIKNNNLHFFRDFGGSTELGLLIKSRDPNYNITEYPKYDSLRRIKQIKKPDDTSPSIEFSYGDDGGDIWSKILRYYDGSNYYTTLYRFDDFDRLYQENEIKSSPVDTLLTEFSQIFMNKTASKTSPEGTASSKTEHYYTKYYKYDAIGRIKEVIQPFEASLKDEGIRGYSGSDKLKTLFDYSIFNNDFSYYINGHTVTLEYADKTTVTDPRGKKKNFIYDAKGQLRVVREIKETDTLTTYYDYDPRGLLTAIKDAKGREITYTYDLRGNLVTRDHFDLDNSETFTYDKNGMLTKKAKPDGRAIRYEYDDINRVTKVKYGGAGETTIVDDFEGTFNWTSDPPNKCAQAFLYKYEGSYSMGITFKWLQPTRAFRVENWDWSAYDSLTLYYKFFNAPVVDTGRCVNVYVKDGNGGSVSTIRNQADTVWHRLALNLNTGNLDKSNVDSIIVKFDAGISKKGQGTIKRKRGNRNDEYYGYVDYICVKPAKSTKVTYTYDSYAAGVTPPTGLNYPKNHLTKMDDEPGWTMYFYDKRGRLGEKWTYFDDFSSDTFKVHYTYNRADQITTITYPGNYTVTYQYDKFGRTENVLGASTNLATVAYDRNSRDSIIDYGDNVKSKFLYYPTNWMKSINVTYPPFVTYIDNSYRYDSTGNRKSDIEGSTSEASYAYDDLNRLTNETHATGGWNINYTYDAVGNRNSAGGSNYTYYSGTDRVKTVGTVTYYYDANGNITSLSDGTSIEYDYRDMATKITESGGTFSTFSYNGDGLRVKTQRESPFGDYGRQSYKEQHNDHTYLHPKGDKHDDARDIGDISIELNSNFLKMDIDMAYLYASQAELENLYITLDTDHIFSSGNIYYPDNLYTKVIPKAAWEYCIYVKSLDDYGIFDKYGNKYEKPKGMVVVYTGGGPNQCIKIKIPSKLIGNPTDYLITILTTMPGFENGTNSRATDVAGGDSLGLQDNTILLTLGLSTPPKYFIRDENGNVLCDINEKGDVKAKYVYANGKHIAKIEGSNKYYYHLDPLGSPLVITKAGLLGAEIAKQYKYKAFGDVKYESGTYNDNHKFTGKELDETGLYYFGARYYDKSLGRWIVPDPKSSPSDLRLNQPQSLNPYVYCWNNPLHRIDKDGNFALALGTYMAIGAGTAVATDFFVSAAMAGKSPVAYWKSGEYSVKRTAIVGGVGALAGAAFGTIAGATISLGTKLALAAGVNVLGKASTKAVIEGKSITPSEAAMAAAVGVISMGSGLAAGKIVSKAPQLIQPVVAGVATGVTSTDVIEALIEKSIDDGQENTPPVQTSPNQYEPTSASPDALLIIPTREQ